MGRLELAHYLYLALDYHVEVSGHVTLDSYEAVAFHFFDIGTPLEFPALV